jgi:phage terminase large subunit
VRTEVKISNGRYPAPEDLVFSAMADIIGNQLAMSGNKRDAFVPLPKQAEVSEKLYTPVKNSPSIVLFRGALGTGKTTLGARLAAQAVMQHPGIAGLMYRATYKELDSTLKARFTEILDSQDIPYKENKKFDWMKFPNGSMIYFRSSDNKGDLGSLELSFAIGDEVNEIKEDFAELLVGRLGRQGKKFPWWNLYLTNPPNRGHWLYGKFEGVSNPGYSQVVSTIDDNPYTTDEYKAFIKSEYASIPSLYRRFVLGEWGADVAGEPVYKGVFSRTTHINTSPIAANPALPVIRSWDFGFHRPACLFAQRQNPMRLFVLKEFMPEKLTIEQFINAVEAKSVEWFPDNDFVDCCDSQGSHKSDLALKTRVDTMKEHGIHPKYRRATYEYRINVVSKLMSTLVSGQPSFIVSPECETLIEGLETGYVWARTAKHAKDTKKPIDDGYYEHLQDALQFLAINYLVAPIALTVDRDFSDLPETSGPTYNFGGSQ